MIVTRNPQIAARCRTMRLHGINRDVFDRYTSTKPQWYYEVVAPGFKYNLTDLASSIGIHQLRKAWQFQKRRQAMAEYYNRELCGLPVDLPTSAAAGETHAWHLYTLRLRQDASVNRNDFIVKMANAGIGCSVHFIPLHFHPYWRDTYHLKESQFPHATSEYLREASLPLYTKMTDADAERVVAAVRQALA